MPSQSANPEHIIKAIFFTKSKTRLECSHQASGIYPPVKRKGLTGGNHFFERTHEAETVLLKQNKRHSLSGAVA